MNFVSGERLNEWHFLCNENIIRKNTDCLYTIKNKKHQAMSAHYLFGSQSMFQVSRYDIDDAHAAMYALCSHKIGVH